MINRTAEKVLSIISAVFTVLGIISTVVMMVFYNFLKSDPMIQKEFEAEMLADPTINPEDLEWIYGMFNFLGGLIWLFVILLIISLILNIIGIVNIWKNKNPKLAGIMFIIAGVLAGIINLTSILLYIAGILCFTKKPPQTNEQMYVDDGNGGTMRPL
jgi:ABC-type phosphate transport system permease subunit